MSERWHDPREEWPNFLKYLGEFYLSGHAKLTKRGVYISPPHDKVAVMYRGWRADKARWPGWPPDDGGEKRSA